MATLQLGQYAYQRNYDSSVEVKLVNRFIERQPANLVEHAALVARPGTRLLDNFGAGPIRGCYSDKGIFGSDLFIVSGNALYRYDGKSIIPIQGQVFGDGNPSVAFVAGAGYERLFIADGRLFQYYDGASTGSATLTYIGLTSTYDQYVIGIENTWYGWTTTDVDESSPDGSREHPWRVKVQAEPLQDMANAINFVGTRGVDFSTNLTQRNLNVSAQADLPNNQITVTSRQNTDASNVPVYVGYYSYMRYPEAANQLQDEPSVTYYGDRESLPLYSLRIGTTYYAWTSGSPDAGSPDGSSSSPWLVDQSSASNGFLTMAKMLNYQPQDADFSSGLSAPDPNALASEPAPDTLALSPRAGGDAATDIEVLYRSPLDFSWSSETLVGGGVHTLKGVEIPNGAPALSCASLDQFVAVSLADSRRFYYVRPGEITIDGLDFASKESAPDAIVDLLRVGDQLVIMGAGSIEFWGASGNSDNPLAPITGRALSRGVRQGSPVRINDSLFMFIGDDFRVYEASSSLKPISDASMEERIRRQERFEAENNT